MRALITRQELENAGLRNELSQMFVLFWEELFHPTSQPSWRVRTCSLSMYLQEVIDVHNVAQEHANYAHNLPHVIDELLRFWGTDPIIASRMPMLSNAIQEISKAKAKKDTLQAAEYAILAKEAATKYPEYLLESLLALLASDTGHRKSEVELHANRLAAHAKSLGHDDRYLRGLHTILIDDTLSFYDRVLRLFERATTTNGRFYCVAAIRWPKQIKADTFHAGSLTLTRTPPDGLDYSHFATPQQSTIYICGNISACDPYAAAQRMKAISIQLLGLLRHADQQRCTFQSGNLAVRNDRMLWEYVPIYDREHVPSTGTDRKRALAEIMQTLHSLEWQSKERLASALEYHRLADESTNANTRLLLLWSAIETLARQDGSAIDSICESVACSAASLRAREHCKEIRAYILRHCDRKPDSFRDFFKSLGIAGPSEMRHRHIARVATGIDEDLVNTFYRECGDFPLIRYRMFRTHENFLKSSKRCRESLEQHYKNIDWQLRRIYRARNGIVHRGSTWLPSVTLSEHLRRYLYATVSNIVQDCPNGSGVTLSLVLRKRRLLWNTYMDRLNKADEPFATERSAIDIAAEVN